MGRKDANARPVHSRFMPMRSSDTAAQLAWPALSAVLRQSVAAFERIWHRTFRKPARLLDVVVGRFAGNDHVVDMAFAQARPGNPHKTRVLLQLGDSLATQIPHPRAQAAH